MTAFLFLTIVLEAAYFFVPSEKVAAKIIIQVLAVVMISISFLIENEYYKEIQDIDQRLKKIEKENKK